MVRVLPTNLSFNSEEKRTATANKVKKERAKRRFLLKNFSSFFAFAVKYS
jgi:hypothetical protein